MTITDDFIGEPLTPDAATMDAVRMAAGEPGLPGSFRWRDETIKIQSVVRSWRETGACSHGSEERYVQKHWYELVSTHGNVRVYFERKPRGGSRKVRWWLYSRRIDVQTP